jgi:hypothetical protein
MSWFNYLLSGVNSYAPVRRKIVFPQVSERLKANDWVHVNLNNLDIGKLFYFEDGLIKTKFDSDSYIVVYETLTSKTPTFSLIVDSSSSDIYKRNLWFKSLTDVEPGSQPVGEYYIYYHKDNIQYIELSGSSYVSTTNPSGNNFIASNSGNAAASINFYSTEVSYDSNQRVSSISFLGDTASWREGKSSLSGSKIIAPFNGPKIKIYATKSSSSGIISLKIVKSSATGDGQKVVKENILIDLYSANEEVNQLIYELDMQTELLFSTYEELYGDFYFEIEILEQKNPASSSFGCKLNKYAYSKNYELLFDDEEIESNIAFKTTGGVK